MGLLRQMVTRSVARVPMTGVINSANGAFGVNAQASVQQGLDAYARNGWLFAAVGRIANATARVDWSLDQSTIDANGNLTLAPQLLHPAKLLWDNWNPFFTEHEGVEVVQQHMELTGEGWILVCRDESGAGDPRELWPVSPARMKPVPSRDQFIGGYIYSIGNERIPLRTDEVLYLRNPDPNDMYRGMGPARAIAVDLENDALAAQWNRTYFQNGAEPGGVIEFPEELDDADFETFVQRWRETHQGVNAAHRVAILERAKWVSVRSNTQRDMEWVSGRKFNRDQILGALAMSGSLLGVTEDVNRANAEAAEYVFARWLLQPRLDRWRMMLNARYLPLFDHGVAKTRLLTYNKAPAVVAGNRLIQMNYDDPTPEDRTLSLTEATGGYRAGILTRNEARGKLGLGEAPDGSGDQFYSGPAAPATDDDGATADAIQEMVRQMKGEGDWPSGISDREAEMARQWKRLLQKERDRIIEYVESTWE